MNETTKSYRIRTTVGEDAYVSVNLEQNYDTIDILSLKIKSKDVYRLHNSNYGVIVGRVLANNGFGIPNAKISIFIGRDGEDEGEIAALYPYSSSASEDNNGIRYNLLPDEKVGDCHQAVGTFPNKRYLLDNEDVIEMFDKYYKYTTRTNNSGDYMICGVPTGNHTLHMDLDLSDCGILSQRPRDFVYKGYTIEQFENPNMFKTGTSYSNLSQIFTQDQLVTVYPFWGNESLGETIGITRADINVAFKFEPTCVFMGCVASENSSQGISKKCIPTPNMGNMDELVTGEGTIEMIRKTFAGSVEEFQIKGTELINSDGIWCYQIPMNLDYMITDEYGNMVPTDNPDKGIPTRTRVRFRISLQDMEKNTANYFRPKVLVPHNPRNLDGSEHENYDYEFGTYTDENSFRDLFWNEVYTVKSYIPRFQKRKVAGWKEDKFTGIKHCQNFGRNNPIPYNNIRIRIPFMFKVMCILIKIFIKITGVINSIISALGNLLSDIGNTKLLGWYPFAKLYAQATSLKMNVIDQGLCPDLENWYFSPMFQNNLWSPPKGGVPPGMKQYNLLSQTLDSINTDDDKYSIDDQNEAPDDKATCLTVSTDYLISCIEMNLANEYKVINFDFYNDWINGLIYIPRFMRYVRKKRKFLGITIVKSKVRGCMDDRNAFRNTRRYTQLCSIGYKKQANAGGYNMYSNAGTKPVGALKIIKANNLHKKNGFTQEKIFGNKNYGICHEKETMYGQYVYYLKPCEWTTKGTPANRKITLYATDIVLLGSLNECDMQGIPQAFKHLSSSSYIMPSNLAITNLEENGPLYGYSDRGTMCSKLNQTTEKTDVNKLMNPVRVIDGGETPLTDELRFYSGASENYDVKYDDPSDAIAITEAAGISWNYTGPGQGKKDPSNMYYPGGHFLGFSCVNSQTNIKSCINLERICEMGVAMSQLKEEVRAVTTDENGDTKFEYTYNVPTGFISGSDVIDDDFRIMFATMNQNRLIATKLNPQTGYKTYDFAYVHPVNFGGDFSELTANGSPYNKARVDAKDETTFLSSFGVSADEGRDMNQQYFMKTRTMEFPSVDYYMFRLGLTYDDLKRNSQRHERQFAKSEHGFRRLPQYENSFYFYFGMRDGATALDEFNKQFFSECETSSLIEREASSYVRVMDYNPCTGFAEILPSIKNTDGEVKWKIEFGDNIAIPEGIELPNGENSTTEMQKYQRWNVWNDDNSVDIIYLPAGSYILRTIDDEGTELTARFSIGENVVSGYFNAYDFNVDNDILARTTANSNMYYGGYVKAEGLTINADNINQSSIEVKAVADGKSPYLTGERKAVTNGNCNLYLSSANTTYDLYTGFKCNGSNSQMIYIYNMSVSLLNTNSVSITIGPVIKSNYKTLNTSAFTEDWWKNLYNSKNDTDDPLRWNIRKSIVKSNGSNEYPFSNNVLVENGVKMIFGTPQNSDGMAYDVVANSEAYETIPAGYSIDDDSSYYETYGVTDYSRANQYNAMAYNGLTVAGKFSARVTGGTGVTKSLTLENGGAGLRDGEGCIFKPLPDGDLYPAIYHSSNRTITCLTENVDAVSEYNIGIVYPTITYPVIKRPFKVRANYFLTRNKIITSTVDGEGNATAQLSVGSKGVKCEAHIINGLTYKHYYGGSSRMAVVTDEETDEGYESMFRVANSVGDLDGITTTGHTDVITYYNGWNDEEPSELSYSISEGAPFYKKGDDYSANKNNGFIEYEDTGAYSNYAEVAGATVYGTFYDGVKYLPYGGYMYFEFDGTSDSDIDYYVVTLESISNVILENTDRNGFVWIWANDASWQTVFLLGQYTRKALYDEEGKDVIVKIINHQNHNPHALIPFTTYEYDGESGERKVVEEYKSVKLDWFNWRVNIDRIYEFVDKVVETFDGRVSFNKDRIVTQASKSTNETSSASWTKTIETAISNGSKINMGGNGTIYRVSPSGRYAVIGVKHIEESDMAEANLYMVYMHPVQKYTITKVGDVFSVVFGDNSTSVTVQNAGLTNKEIKITITREYVNRAIFVDGIESWTTVKFDTGGNRTISNGGMITDTDIPEGANEKTITLYLDISQNTAAERSANIKFTLDDSGTEYIRTLNIRQLGV